MRYAVHCFEVFENKLFIVGLLNAFFVCPRLGWSCLSLVARSGFVFQCVSFVSSCVSRFSLRWFLFWFLQLVWFHGLYRNASYPALVACSWTFGLLSSRPSLYLLYTLHMLYMLFIFGGNRCFFNGPTWRVHKQQKNNALNGCPTSWASHVSPWPMFDKPLRCCVFTNLLKGLSLVVVVCVICYTPVI